MPEMAQLQNCLPHKHEDLPSNHLYPCKKPDTTIWLCQLLASVCMCTHMHTHTNAETKCPHIHTLSHTRPLSVVLKLLYQNHLESYLGPWGSFHLSLDTAIWQRYCPPPKLNFPVILKLLTTHENTHPLWVLDVENMKESESKAGCRSPTLHHQAGMFRNGGRF